MELIEETDGRAPYIDIKRIGLVKANFYKNSHMTRENWEQKAFNLVAEIFKEYFDKTKVFNDLGLNSVKLIYERMSGVLLKEIKGDKSKLILRCESAKTGKKMRENLCEFELFFEKNNGKFKLLKVNTSHHTNCLKLLKANTSHHTNPSNEKIPPLLYRQLRKDIKNFEPEVSKVLQKGPEFAQLSPKKILLELMENNVIEEKYRTILIKKGDNLRQYYKKPLDNMVNKVKKKLNINISSGLNISNEKRSRQSAFEGYEQYSGLDESLEGPLNWEFYDESDSFRNPSFIHLDEINGSQDSPDIGPTLFDSDSNIIQLPDFKFPESDPPIYQDQEVNEEPYRLPVKDKIQFF